MAFLMGLLRLLPAVDLPSTGVSLIGSPPDEVEDCLNCFQDTEQFTENSPIHRS
jgi:hypothetical protein